MGRTLSVTLGADYGPMGVVCFFSLVHFAHIFKWMGGGDNDQINQILDANRIDNMQCSYWFQLDIITLLAILGLLMTRYGFLFARRTISSNDWTNSNLTYTSTLWPLTSDQLDFLEARQVIWAMFKLMFDLIILFVFIYAETDLNLTQLHFW